MNGNSAPQVNAEHLCSAPRKTKFQKTMDYSSKYENLYYILFVGAALKKLENTALLYKYECEGLCWNENLV